ncbi:hypothetical protein NMY22_g5055 [Coprinellus aureogranulatus]|nr:hypothetical protein NMY22_g5055 [Coprinellus aureogranulatus]
MVFHSRSLLVSSALDVHHSYLPDPSLALREFRAYIVLPQLENTTNDIGTGIRAWKESIGRAACEVPLVGWWHPKCKLLEDPSASKTDSAFEVFDVVFRPSLGNSATFTALAQNMEKIGLATQALADVVDGSELPRKDKLVSWLEQFAAEAEATNLALLKFDSDLRLAFGYISSRNQIARETIQQARDDERTLLAKVSSVWRRGRGEKLERLVTELLEDTARRFNDQFERLSEQALNTDARLVRLNVMSDKIRSTAQQDRGSLEKSVSSESVLISLWKRYGRGKSTYKENLTVLDSLKRHRKETRARVSDALRSLRNDKRQVEKMVFISSPGELDKERAYAEKYWDSFVRKEFEDYRDGREQGLSS